jgi:hypothetical protein
MTGIVVAITIGDVEFCFVNGCAQCHEKIPRLICRLP